MLNECAPRISSEGLPDSSTGCRIVRIVRSLVEADGRYVSAVFSGVDEGYSHSCLLYTSDAADERSSVDLGGRRIIKKKKYINTIMIGS